MTIGILAAMHDEIADLISAMAKQGDSHVRRIGMRDYYVGELEGQPCVLVLSRLGKVAAAATAVTLIREFGVTELVFTGLAGGVGPHVKVGDIVVGYRLIQHDLDARPLFPRHEVPLLGQSEFAADLALGAELEAAAGAFLREDLPQAVPPENRKAFGIDQPVLHVGMIASGDQFVADIGQANEILSVLPDALAVEMEGAAVAQICFEYDVPCAVLRTISDRADASAHIDFGKFLSGVASHYSTGILRRLLAARRSHAQMAGAEIRVRGLVQGVGFRANVWRLACECGLVGDVRNDSDGVLIRAWGAQATLDRFVLRIGDEAPPLARIDALERRPLYGIAPAGPFRIAASSKGLP